MKTKIIYISGNEIFDMADIRAAFDTVRAALGLDNDTILFGVPIDSDDAFAHSSVTTIAAPVVDESDLSPDTKITASQDTSPAVEPSVTPIDTPINTAKVKRTTRRQQHTAPIDIAPDTPENDKTDTADDATIPILSVLGAKSESDAPIATPEAVVEPEPIIVTPIDNISVATDTDNKPTNDATDTQSVSISDMLADDSAPVSAHEKTLEELLESMTPLGEDEKPEPIPTQTPATDIISPSEPEVENEQHTNSDDTDATLELLATEFAASADEIVAPTKPTTRGKIGKLKNILPFKPKKHNDDGGIMGDLFGWAGVANDEDFTIPGFFANASSKK